MQRPNNNEAGGWFLRGRAPLKKCHKWYGASAGERGRSRGFERAMAEVVSPQNRRERLKDVVHDVQGVLHVDGLGVHDDGVHDERVR